MMHSRLFSTFALLLGSLSISACANEVQQTNAQEKTNQSASLLASSASQTSNLATIETSITKLQIPFQEWLVQLQQEARNKGIHEQTIVSATPLLKLNPKVLELDQQQPEFTQTFWTYLDKRLSEIRIQAGKVQAFRYDSLLKKIQAEQGLPANILVAFWGLETNYGTYLGSFNTLEALTTLAYDTRRSAFFRKELLAALTIVDQGHVKAEDMHGSWAGAIGQMQFMPTVFLKHAVDADGDHKADLWNSTTDALTSAAVYLKKAGWQANQPWLQEVRLPQDFDYAIADGRIEMSVQQVQQLGVRPIENQWLGTESDRVSLLLPAGHEGPAFVIWPNFKVIKRWNNSNNYALAVSLLAQRLAGQAPLSIKPPLHNQPWAKSFIVSLQETLTNRGYDTGGADGWFGSKSMQALRQYQKDNNLPADGYPNQTTLRQLQLTQ